MVAKTNVKVKLIGESGNAFAILAAVVKALKEAGYEKEAKEYVEEAIAGDYDDLLVTTMKYVTITS